MQSITQVSTAFLFPFRSTVLHIIYIQKFPELPESETYQISVRGYLKDSTCDLAGKGEWSKGY